MGLHTARAVQGYADLASYVAWLQRIAATRGVPFAPPRRVDLRAAAAIAQVNHGRWIAECPDGCGGAMLVSPGDPFLCGNCFNAAIAGQWRQLIWPEHADAIEDVLLRRPLEDTRNWRPDELVSELRLENLREGVSF